MKANLFLATALCLLFSIPALSQKQNFNGLDMNLGNLSRISNAETRSISPENFSGEKGKGAIAVPQNPNTRNVNNASWAARDLGEGWKVNPYIIIDSGQTVTIAEMDGPGAIQHIWMTPTGIWRWSIIRIYWDNETEPSVECPISDFFAWDGMSTLLSSHYQYA